MFAMDVAYIPVIELHAVMAEASSMRTDQPVDFILNDCQETDSTFSGSHSWSAVYAVDPAYLLRNYFSSIGRNINLSKIKVSLLQGTKHGHLSSEIDNLGRTSYHYDPSHGFLGDDHAIFLTEYDGKKFKINLVIRVVYVIDQNASQCFDPVMIKAPAINKDSSISTVHELTSSVTTFIDYTPYLNKEHSKVYQNGC